MNRPHGVFKRKPAFSKESQGRFSKLSKADWADCYADLYRQCFGESETTEEIIMADAESRIVTLRRYQR